MLCFCMLGVCMCLKKTKDYTKNTPRDFFFWYISYFFFHNVIALYMPNFSKMFGRLLFITFMYVLHDNTIFRQPPPFEIMLLTLVLQAQVMRSDIPTAEKMWTDSSHERCAASQLCCGSSLGAFWNNLKSQKNDSLCAQACLLAKSCKYAVWQEDGQCHGFHSCSKVFR